MAVDFGILERTPMIGEQIIAGQQAAQQDAERNMLRRMQMQQMAIQQENMLAQRENLAAQREERAAHAEERRAKIAQARAAEARLEQLAQSVGQPVTEESLRKMQADALRSGNPAAVTLIGNIAKDYQTAQEGRRVAALFGPQEMPTGAPAVAPAAPAEAPVNVLAAPAAMPAAPAAMPTAPAAAAAPPALGARRETVRIGGRDFTEQDLLQLSADPNPRVQAAAKAGLDLMKANKPPTDQAMMTSLGIPLTPEGFARYKSLGQQPAGDIQAYNLAVQQGFKGDIFEFKRQLAMAGRAPAQPPQPPQPQPPVAVVDPTTGKTVYVSREEALSGRMTPAASIEGLTPKEKQTREAKYPQATAALKGFELTSDTLIKDLKALAAHPGLGSITGIVAGRAPGITAEGRAAQALYDKVLARGGFQELQAMRQASPTGGALGNVSNQEGAQLKAAFAAVDRRQDAADVRKAITDAIAQIEASKRNVRDAYDLTYEYRQPAGAPAPAAAPASATGAGRRREIAPGVFVTERP